MGWLLATLTFLLEGSTDLILFLQTPSSHSCHQYVGILREDKIIQNLTFFFIKDDSAVTCSV